MLYFYLQTYTFILSFILASHPTVPFEGPTVGSLRRVPPKCPGSWVPFSQYAVFVGLHKGNCLNELGEILFSGQW